jgi:tetratricopeptide (TPR) repeat protein
MQDPNSTSREELSGQAEPSDPSWLSRFRALAPRTQLGLACLALVLAVFAVYGRVATNEFVSYDTPLYLTRNPNVLRGLTWEGARWAFTTFDAGNWHPLTWLSHMLDVQVFGPRPGPLHLVNVAIHAANACLVFLVLRRMTGAFFPSLSVAALFALHPLHVESVAWIVERKDVLCAFFGLLCLWLWTGWVRSKKRSDYLLALSCFAAGLLAKSMIVTWPCVLLLFDVWPYARARLGARRLVLEKLPFFFLSIALSVVTFFAQRAGGAVRNLDVVPLSDRFSNAAIAYASYLEKAFWPFDLSFFYPHAHHGLWSIEAGLSLLFLGGVSALAFACFRRAPWILVGWLFYLGTLVPVIGLVQVGDQSMADRYTYLPLLGVFVALVWSAAKRLEVRPGDASWIPAVALSTLGVLGCLTWRQAGVWKDTRTLCVHGIAIDARNQVAHNLLALDDLERGDLEHAVSECRAALGLTPDNVEALANLGNILYLQHAYAETEDLFRRAVRGAPDRSDFHLGLSVALNAQEKRTEALSEVDEALRIDPSLAAGHATRAEVLEKLGREDEARESWIASLRLDPGQVAARLQLARLLVRHGDARAAEEEVRRAITSAPADADARRQLDLLLIARGSYAEALSAAREALRLKPTLSPAMGDVVWILAMADDPNLRDAAAAVEMGEQAALASGQRDPEILDALAAAYASQGRFEQAVATAELARSVATSAGAGELAARIGTRIAAYREGRMDRKAPR